MTDHFSIMPVEIFMDDRLSKTDLRVLGAIMSWRNKDTNLCHPSREQISERCGLSTSKISTATTHLSELGWLEKSGNGGRSMRCVYKFRVPDLSLLTVLILETVPESGTVPKLGTKTVPESGTKTVPELGRGKELKETKRKLKEITLSEFLNQCKERNEKALPDDHYIFTNAKEAKIPDDYLYLAWTLFKRQIDPQKKYIDWRKAFSNYVNGNYLNVWGIDKEGNYYLTTVGKQIQKEVA